LTLGFIWNIIDHSILPAFTILITSIGGWILTMRNNMITVVAEDYVKMDGPRASSPVASSGSTPDATRSCRT